MSIINLCFWLPGGSLLLSESHGPQPALRRRAHQRVKGRDEEVNKFPVPAVALVLTPPMTSNLPRCLCQHSSCALHRRGIAFSDSLVRVDTGVCSNSIS